jgi:hypothetical protein
MTQNLWFSQIPEYMKKRGMNWTALPPKKFKKKRFEEVDEMEDFLAV